MGCCSCYGWANLDSVALLSLITWGQWIICHISSLTWLPETTLSVGQFSLEIYGCVCIFNREEKRTKEKKKNKILLQKEQLCLWLRKFHHLIHIHHQISWRKIYHFTIIFYRPKNTWQYCVNLLSLHPERLVSLVWLIKK